MICKDCKKNKPETEFNLTEDYRRNQCKSCTKKNASVYLNPESFYNLFIGKESWKDIYFKKTIVSRKSF
jgi:protein-arginine kinase activator protein McsA